MGQKVPAQVTTNFVAELLIYGSIHSQAGLYFLNTATIDKSCVFILGWHKTSMSKQCLIPASVLASDVCICDEVPMI